MSEERIKSFVITILSLLLCAHARAQEPAIDLTQARAYFQEIEQLTAADAGRLWGRPLAGPVLFAERATRTVVANVADAEHRLTEREGIWVGKLSGEQNVANTAVDWAGRHWTMVVWPVPAEKYARQRLFAHELFHRIQNDLGIRGSDPPNAHLGTREGRIWTRLEWRALAEALIREGAARRAALADALTFRAKRRTLFLNARAEEQALEINEGLAEYTGLRLSGLPLRLLPDRAAVQLANSEQQPALARSFAYASGPAYALLLDAAVPRWRRHVTSRSDLSESARTKYHITVDTSTAEARAWKYDGARLIAEETQRAARLEAQLAARRRQFIEGPVLSLLPGERFRYAFDPNAAEPLGDVGTVFESSRITDMWGTLNVESGGVLLERTARGITRVVVAVDLAAPTPPLAGKGWKLELADGWQVVPGDRAGDWKVVRK